MIHGRILIVGVVLAAVLSLPFYGHNWHMLMHQIGAILFLGNIIVSAVWMSLAKRSGSIDAFRLGAHGIALTDAMFTAPAGLVLALNGGALGTNYFRMHAMWLFVSMGLFLLTLVIWLAVLLPAQRRLIRLLEAAPAGTTIGSDVMTVYRRWFRFGGIAMLLPLAALVLMVFKPAL